MSTVYVVIELVVELILNTMPRSVGRHTVYVLTNNERGMYTNEGSSEYPVTSSQQLSL